MSESTIHRWPHPSLNGDMIRGAIAFGVSLLLLLIAPIGSPGFFAVIVLLVLFGSYLASTISKWSSVVTVGDDGISTSGGLFGGRSITWKELQRFDLRYFPLSRDRKQGWMELKLKSARTTIVIDDRLDRFSDVLARAWAAARAADVGISDATHANLVHAGLVTQAKY
jgi:hypothetical protein